jgi:O-antigen/teichoic acid export membrane protein
MNRKRVGLALLGLLSLTDLATLPLSDGKHPPYAVAVISFVLGLAALVLVIRSWRRPGRPVRLLVALRMASAATALPAFVVAGVPVGAQVAATGLVVLTGVALALIARDSHTLALTP